jgi:hypothetical protein
VINPGGEIASRRDLEKKLESLKAGIIQGYWIIYARVRDESVDSSGTLSTWMGKNFE